MNSTIFLTFPDRAAALSLAAQVDEVHIPGDERLRFADHWGGLVVIGEMWVGGEWDETGNEVAPPTLVPGWHIMLSLNPGYQLPTLLEPYVAEPDPPHRVFG
jgi:hypothetical protein